VKFGRRNLLPNYPNEISPLERYGHHLTERVKPEFLPLWVPADGAISRLFQILLRRTKNNPVLVDWDEPLRWRLIAELNHRITVGDVPDLSPFKQVIALNDEALFAHLS
jgi:ATP-dependent Clp protease ATP-binding subunit ClpB